MSACTKDQIKADLLNEIAKYVGTPVAIKDIFYTDWQHDPYTLGSYSYAKVGTAPKHFKNLRSVLANGNNKMWFIGEHTHPNWYSYTQGGYLSGVQGAKEALSA